MATIEIEGHKYKVLDSLGYVHDVSAYVKEVETEDGPKKAVKPAGRGFSWRFWTAKDRAAPLLRHLEAQRQRRKAIVAAQWDHGFRGYTSHV
ncbi:hypothetical protein [Pseudodesulfovibrio sp.]|uniref:hypothetical protein n=1 Tax=Pseudodesulfovibrio sp. TaxID=2035812 RepID=UPI002616007E|nr:hypothetical protein [Pseudodesulfovibrio sp.]MDD3310995.1 hypothetical protein [Pseudodesulfovibrio sp.]